MAQHADRGSAHAGPTDPSSALPRVEMSGGWLSRWAGSAIWWGPAATVIAAAVAGAVWGATWALLIVLLLLSALVGAVAWLAGSWRVLVGGAVATAVLASAVLLTAEESPMARRGGIDLGGADLRGSNLSNADLRGADLRGADLREACLRGADLRSADLAGADLENADVSGVHIDTEMIQLVRNWPTKGAGSTSCAR